MVKTGTRGLTVKVGLAVTAAVGILALSAAPAHAWDNPVGGEYAVHGNDQGWTEKVPDEGRYRAHVRDNECDGHRVWAEYYRGGSDYLHTLDDSNGCTGGSWQTPADTHRVWKLRVCESTKGCSSWITPYD